MSGAITDELRSFAISAVHSDQERGLRPLYTCLDRDGRPVAHAFNGRYGPYVSVRSDQWVCEIYVESRMSAVRMCRAIGEVLR